MSIRIPPDCMVMLPLKGRRGDPGNFITNLILGEKRVAWNNRQLMHQTELFLRGNLEHDFG